MMSEQHYCDQCDNQCPIDSLRCNKGRIRFGQEPVENKRLDGPLGLLQKCGFVLHHGNLEQEDALSALNTQERAELERMLSVLLADWEKRMPEGLSGARQGRGRGHH